MPIFQSQAEPYTTGSRWLDIILQGLGTAVGPTPMGGVTNIPARGFSRLRPATPGGLYPGEQLENMLRALGGSPTGSGVSRSGALAESGATGQLSRGWPGIYKEAITKGRSQPRSYRAPKTYHLEE